MSCPSLVELESFVSGQLAEQPSTRIESHLTECSTCVQRLGSFDSHPSCDGEFGTEPEVPTTYQDEPELQVALSEIRNFAYDDAVETSSPLRIFREAVNEIQVAELIDRGGMGVLYRGVHHGLGKAVAIKMLPGGSLRSSESIARFEREVRAIGQLDHENIVRAMDARQIGDTRFLIMEFIDGLDLRDLVEGFGQLPVAESCEIVRQIASGLQHAHERGIVHRDIKPRNVMITRTGVVKVLDLGLARLQDDVDAESITKDSQVLGTLDYLAPEQADDEGAVDRRTDLYSLGCTLYFLLTSRAPFADRSTAVKKIMAHVGSVPEPISELRNDCPPELIDVVNRMLQKSPDDRFSTAKDVVDQLTVLSSGAKLRSLLQHADDVPLNRSADAPVSVKSNEMRSSTIRRKRGMRMAIVSIGMLVATALAVVVAEYKLARGTLRVAADDSVAVRLEAGTVTIYDKQRNEEYDLQVGESPMRPGEYEIVVENPSSGLKFSTNKFEISRRRQTVVSVSLLDRADVTESTGDVEREIAEWAFGMGAKSIYLAEPNGPPRHIHSRLEFPAEFQILELDLRNLRTLNDDHLLRLQRLSRLRTVLIGDTRITDNGILNLSKIKSLEELHAMHCSEITAVGLSHLKAAPNLRLLYLDQCPNTEAEFKAVGTISTLQVVGISSSNLVDDWLRHFSELKKLDTISLAAIESNRIGGEGFRFLKNCPKIRMVVLCSNHLTLAGMRELAKLTTLQELNLSLGNLNDRLFEPLTALENLTRLVLVDTKITDASTERLLQFSKLRTLELSGSDLTDASLATVSRLGSLRDLILADLPITDAGIGQLESLPKIQRIDVRATQVTLNGVRSLRQKLPDCEVVCDFPNR